MNKSTKKINAVAITQMALFAALQCVLGPFSIVFPFTPVPISLVTLILYLSVCILGKKKSVISCGIYLLIGLTGLPVFSGFTGGIGKVLGPTGGYLVGYLLLVFISGWYIEKRGSINNEKKDEGKGKRKIKGILYVQGFCLGTMACYLFGSIWFSYQAKINIQTAFLSGVVPFLVGDIIKMAVAIRLGNVVRQRLSKAGILQ